MLLKSKEFLMYIKSIIGLSLWNPKVIYYCFFNTNFHKNLTKKIKIITFKLLVSKHSKTRFQYKKETQLKRARFVNEQSVITIII